MKRITNRIKKRPVLYACAVILAVQTINLMAHPPVIAALIFLSGIALCSHHLWAERHYTIARLHGGGYRADCRERACVDDSSELIVYAKDLLTTISIAHTHHRDHVNLATTNNSTRGKS